MWRWRIGKAAFVVAAGLLNLRNDRRLRFVAGAMALERARGQLHAFRDIFAGRRNHCHNIIGLLTADLAARLVGRV